jgi:hypothetical protein
MTLPVAIHGLSMRKRIASHSCPGHLQGVRELWVVAFELVDIPLGSEVVGPLRKHKDVPMLVHDVVVSCHSVARSCSRTQSIYRHVVYRCSLNFSNFF